MGVKAGGSYLILGVLMDAVLNRVRRSRLWWRYAAVRDAVIVVDAMIAVKEHLWP